MYMATPNANDNSTDDSTLPLSVSTVQVALDGLGWYSENLEDDPGAYTEEERRDRRRNISQGRSTFRQLLRTYNGDIQYSPESDYEYLWIVFMYLEQEIGACHGGLTFGDEDPAVKCERLETAGEELAPAFENSNLYGFPTE